MDVQQLHQCFAATLDANQNTRITAELQLKEAEKVPGFINGCLDIVTEPSVSPGIQIAAAVFLKNKVIRHWVSYQQTPGTTIDADEKPVFRDRLIPALIAVNHTIRPTIVAILQAVVSMDFPTQWPELLNYTVTLLNKGDVASMHAGLICLREICAHFRFAMRPTRETLDNVVNMTFEGLRNVGMSLVNEDSTAAGEMLVCVVKSYKCATYIEIPASLQQQQTVFDWIQLFTAIVKKPYPQEVLQLDDASRELHPWTKCKKWACANMFRLFQRYASTADTISDKMKAYKNFKKMFINDIVPEILSVYFGEIELWVQNKVWLGKAVLYHIIAFMEECIPSAKTWKLIKPHVNGLITHVLFPCMCQTQESLEQFEEEPEEYINIRMDFYGEASTADVAASSFLHTFIKKKRSSVFSDFMTFIMSVVNEHQANPDDHALSVRKEGALKMMSTISVMVLEKSSPVADKMEEFLKAYVYPDFFSKYGFLRARACEVMRNYASVQFKDIDNVSYAYQALLKCLEDENLPVQIEAALALEPLIAHDDVKNALSTRIQGVMDIILKLADRIDIDALSGVMEKFVDVFSAELTPFAVELASRLCSQLVRLITELIDQQNADVDDADMSEDKVMTSLGIIGTLNSLLVALDNSPEIVLKLEEVMMPVFVIIIQNRMIEFYQEVFSLIETSTFTLKAISPNMWKLFGIIWSNFDEETREYLGDIYPALENYIIYGAQELATNADYKKAMFGIISTTIADTDRLSPMEWIAGLSMAQEFLLSLRGGHADEYFGPLLNLSCTRLKYLSTSANKTTRYEVYLLESFLAALYYNAGATLAHLEATGITETFFQTWFSTMERFTRAQDKVLIVLSLISILVLPDELIPAKLQSNIPEFGQALVSVIGTLPKAVEKRNQLAKELSSGDYDYYDDEYEEGDGWEAEGADDEEDDVAGGAGAANAGAVDPAAEYVEYLASESAKLQATKQYGYWEEDNEDLEEEPLAEGVLHNLNAYAIFRDTLSSLQQSRPDRYNLIMKKMTPADEETIQTVVKLADGEVTNKN